MAQHDYVIANGTGAAVRSDLNNALAAIVSQNSGATEPATTYAFQFWADTTTGTLKLRNSANSAWIELLQLDGTLTMEDGTEALPGLSFRSDLDTGLWRPGANQLAISTNAVERVEFGASEVVFNDGGANYDFRVEGDTNANLLFVDASADAVGIGTSSPSNNLHVVGDSDSGRQLRLSGGSSNAMIKAVSPNRTFSFGATTSNFTIYDDDAAVHRLFINSSGNVGIGTTSPSNALHIAATTPTIRLQDTDGGRAMVSGADGNLTFEADPDSAVASSHIKFNVDDTERARIDSSGRWLLGTSSDSSSGRLVVQGSPAGSGLQGVLVLKRDANNPVSGVQALGSIDFKDLSNGHGASIDAISDGGWNTPSDCPTRLVFSTTADGASSPTERAKITNAGYFKATTLGAYVGDNEHEFINNTNNKPVLRLQSNAGNGTQYGLLIRTVNDQNDATRHFFQCLGDTTERVTFRSNGGLANYSANNVNLSDITTKKDIIPAAGTWDCIKEWEIVNYRYKDQPDDADLNLGVIAQQVAESCPEVITVFEEAKDDQPEKLGIKEQQMYWMAIKALQEAQIRIEQLEAKVAALEAA